MNGNKAEIEASEWLARLDGDDISSQDIAEFARWQDADPRNLAAYARLAATWQALERIQAVRPSAAEPVDEDYLADARRIPYRESLPPYLEQVTQRSSRSSAAARFLPGGRRLFVVAIAAALVTLVTFWSLRRPGAPRIFSTDVGGFQRVVLEDRSVMELNTASEVRVLLTRHARKVELVRGEAGFEVAHEASRPFIVTAGSVAVRAVGTKFDVRSTGGSAEVTVSEGKVVIGSPGLLDGPQIAAVPALLHVSAGQTATSSDGGMSLRTLPKDGLARKLAWQNQMLVFDSDTLAAVVAQFNRYNSRRIVIADPKLATVKISGYFRPTNLDAFLGVLQADFGVRVNISGNQIVLVAAATK